MASFSWDKILAFWTKHHALDVREAHTCVKVEMLINAACCVWAYIATLCVINTFLADWVVCEKFIIFALFDASADKW